MVALGVLVVEALLEDDAVGVKDGEALSLSVSLAVLLPVGDGEDVAELVTVIV